MIQAGGPATLLFANATLVALPPGTPRRAVSLAPPPGAVPREFFGLNLNNPFTNSWWNGGVPGPVAYPWPVLDFGYLRTWDSGVAWHTIQASRA